MAPPTIGASAGAMAKIIEMWLMNRWARAPSKRSRTTVRPTIIPAPATRPWAPRAHSRRGMLGASAHRALVTAYSAQPREDDGTTTEGIGQRPVEEARDREGDEVDADGLLHRDLVDAELAGHHLERREDRVDRERPDHRQRREDEDELQLRHARSRRRVAGRVVGQASCATDPGTAGSGDRREVLGRQPDVEATSSTGDVDRRRSRMPSRRGPWAARASARRGRCRRRRSRCCARPLRGRPSSRS